MLEPLLTEEQRALRDEIRAFVQSVPRHERHNRATVTWSVDGPPIIVQGGPNASIYRN